MDLAFMIVFAVFCIALDAAMSIAVLGMMRNADPRGPLGRSLIPFSTVLVVSLVIMLLLTVIKAVTR